MTQIYTHTQYDQERVEHAKTVVQGLLKQYGSKPLRALFSCVWDRFSTAPSSEKAKFHGAYEGGLLEHTLFVYKFLSYLNKSVVAGYVDLTAEFGLTADKIERHDELLTPYPEETIFKVAILHDLGKIGTEDNSYYERTEEQWKIKRGDVYDRQQMPIWVPTQSLYWAQKFGVDLTEEEYQAILCHDGMYTELGKLSKGMESRLLLLLHWSDMWCASKIEV